MVLMWYLIGLVVTCAAGWFFSRRKPIESKLDKNGIRRMTKFKNVRSNAFDYANRLDQAEEDQRIDVFINSAATRAVFEYKSIENMTIDSFLFVVMKTVNYKIFDSYTAKYKDVDIEGLIRQKFNDLIR